MNLSMLDSVPEAACRSLSVEIKDFPVNLRSLQDKYCKDVCPAVIRAASNIEHIFGELYVVLEKVKLLYFKRLWLGFPLKVKNNLQ